MRVLRSTLYLGTDGGVSTVLRESDTVDTLDSIMHRLNESDALVVYDLFELDDEGGIMAATAEAMARRDLHIEQNMAILYYWSVESWRLITDGGTIRTTRPAPLSREQITYVLERLAARTDYRNYTIEMFTIDGDAVTLAEGKVT